MHLCSWSAAVRKRRVEMAPCMRHYRKLCIQSTYLPTYVGIRFACLLSSKDSHFRTSYLDTYQPSMPGYPQFVCRTGAGRADPGQPYGRFERGLEKRSFRMASLAHRRLCMSVQFRAKVINKLAFFYVAEQ